MNRFKNIAMTALFSLGTFFAVTFTACNKDECKDVVCNNGGTCVSGTCSCLPGYEGTNCQTESRTKFVDQYNVTAACQATYIATISSASGSDVQRVTINNFANLNSAAGTTTSVYANINGSTITIPTQTVVGFSSATITASGDGTYNSDGTLTLNYQVISGGTTNTCSNTTWQ